MIRRDSRGRLTDRIASAFEKFRDENPDVEDRLVSLLEEYAAEGATYVSIKHLWEIMRRARWLSTRGELWKLNNDYTSRYARLIAAARPDLAPLLRMRRLAGEPTDAELEAAERQVDAFPETRSTSPAQPVSRGVATRRQSIGNANLRRDEGGDCRDMTERVVGQRVACDFCAMAFDVRRAGQRFCSARCRTQAWMKEHPRV